MKKYVLLAFLNLWFALGCAQAQTSPISVNLPFDFVAGNTTFPAGRYTILPISTNGNAVLLRSADSNRSAVLWLCNCASQNTSEVAGPSRIVFRMSENQYYLWQIWTQGYDVGREVSVSAPTARSSTASELRKHKEEDVVIIPVVAVP